MSESKESAPLINSTVLNEGYNQTYLIFPPSDSDEEKNASFSSSRDVFFRCGNWCYRGPIDFNGNAVGTSKLSVLIPILQRQQSSLRYYCNASSMKIHNDINEPLDFLQKACEFVAEEVTSSHVDDELRKWSSVFPWIDDDKATTYFELTLEPPKFMSKVSLIASKTYNRGLIVIGIYFEGTFYFVLLPGEGEQHLLDVRFPDVSCHGQGLHIASYREETPYWRKLTLWHTVAGGPVITTEAPRDVAKSTTTNISSAKYIQTYCILKSEPNPSGGGLSVQHEALFRFGSWCYSGKVQLTPELSLSDVPFVIPALRMQQSRLTYLCDAARMPNASLFTKPLEFIHDLSPFIEDQICKSEETLQALIERLSRMGLGDSVTKWLEGEACNSFFEFRIASTPEIDRMMKKVELIASKCYHPSGIITITLVFQKTIYVTIAEGGEENPLLDSKFPDVSAKGRGYQLHSYPEGVDGWEQLRKVTIWQTVNALEEEFKDRAAKLGEAKKQSDKLKNEASALPTSSDVNDEGNPSNTSVRKVLRQSSTQHSFQHRLDDYHSIMDDEYDDRVAESKSSSRAPQQRKSFEDTTQSVSQTLGQYAKSSSNLADMSKDTPSSFSGGGGMDSPAAKNVADEKSAPNSSSSNEAAGFGSKVESPGASSRFHVARPHHLPKMNGLSSLSGNMEKIRMSMGEEGAAPNWNAFGKPLKKLGQAKDV